MGPVTSELFIQLLDPLSFQRILSERASHFSFPNSYTNIFVCRITNTCFLKADFFQRKFTTSSLSLIREILLSADTRTTCRVHLLFTENTLECLWSHFWVLVTLVQVFILLSTASQTC